jgi:hypothetical protein
MYDFYSDGLVWTKDTERHYCWGNQTLLVNFTLENLNDLIGFTDYDPVPVYLADLYLADDRRVNAARTRPEQT